MRIATLSSAFALLAAVHATQNEYSPFFSPYSNNSPRALLMKRQSCPTNYNSCSSLGSGTTCCPSDTNCVRDQAGNIACCPFSASCTGSIEGTATGSLTTSNTTPFVLGGTTATSTPVIATTPAGVAGGGSTVPNAIYPFVYIPTTYENAALCSSYWTSCQAQSSSCLASLDGGANGVTVAGITSVQGASTTLPSASAASICSVLSTSACYGLQESQCSSFGTGTAGLTTTAGGGIIQSGAARPRITCGPEMMYAMGAGAVVGAAGVLI